MAMYDPSAAAAAEKSSCKREVASGLAVLIAMLVDTAAVGEFEVPPTSFLAESCSEIKSPQKNFRR